MIPPTVRIEQGVKRFRIFLLGEDCNILDEKVRQGQRFGPVESEHEQAPRRHSLREECHQLHNGFAFLLAIGLLREPYIDEVGANIGNLCSCAMKMAPILSDNCDGLPKLERFKCDASPLDFELICENRDQGRSREVSITNNC
jgi:hypothetical protein